MLSLRHFAILALLVAFSPIFAKATVSESPAVDVLSFEEFSDLKPEQQQAYLDGLNDLLFRISGDQERYPSYFSAANDFAAKRYPFISHLFWALPQAAEAKESEELKRARAEAEAARKELDKAKEDRDRLKTSQGEAPAYILNEIKELEAKWDEKDRKVRALENASGEKTAANPKGLKWVDPVTAAKAAKENAEAHRVRDQRAIEELKVRAGDDPNAAKKRDEAVKRFEERERMGCYIGRQDGRPVDPRCEFGDFKVAGGKLEYTDRCGQVQKMDACESISEDDRKLAVKKLAAKGELTRDPEACASGFNPAETAAARDCKLGGGAKFFEKTCDGDEEFMCSPWVYGARKGQKAGEFYPICGKVSGLRSQLNTKKTGPARRAACSRASALADDRGERTFGFVSAAISSLKGTYEANYQRIFNRICNSPTAITARCETCMEVLPRLSELNKKNAAQCPTAAKAAKKAPAKKPKAVQ